MIILRPYQQRLVDAVRASYGAGKQSVCMVAPTGSGKGVCLSYIALNAVEKGKRILILAHRRKLVRQIATYMTGSFSYIMDKFEHNALAPIQLATVQTLARRDTSFTPNLIVVDEGHLGTSASYRAIYAKYPHAKRLIVTATPEGTGGVGLKDICDDLVSSISMCELIDMGYLVRTRVFAPPVVDVSNVRTVGSDYDAEAVAALIDKPTVHGDVLQHYRLLAMGRITLAFCNTVAESVRMAQLFRDNSIPAESLDSSNDDDYKDAVLDRLARREIAVVFNCALFIEGLDLPCIDCVMDLAATQRLTRYLQKIGRGTRPAFEKVDNLYIDFTANYLRHGMPAQDREWSLEWQIKKKKDHPDNIQVRQCPECFAAFLPQDHCPECGIIIPVKPRKIKYKGAWLTEIEIEAIELKKKHDNMELWKARTLEDFLKIARERGYEKGWAYMRYKLKQKKR